MDNHDKYLKQLYNIDKNTEKSCDIINDKGSTMMEKNIRNFIKEYESRISDCDILIKNTKEQNSKVRNDKTLSESERAIEQLHLRVDRIKECSKQQAYVQFISNLKELLGEI